MSGLLSGPAPRVWTIPATAPFLDVLVDAIVDAVANPDDPFALADALILLPNRRAGEGLMAAFARRLGGAALLPAMRPLGDLDDDPDVWGPDPLAFDVPPAIDPLARRLELAALVRARDAAAEGAADPVRALAFADELRRLMDGAAAVVDVDWDRLPGLVQDRDLAAHWAQSAQFLEIVQRYWPQRLAAEGLCDPADRRNRLLDALAARWTADPPTTPVIIAGSTGSVAATRRLMAVAARLPKGAVVLPGLDADLDDAAWDGIEPQHPQFSIKATLAALGLDRAAVRALAEPARPARRLLLREALAPAERTADWLARLEALGGAALAAEGAAGVTLLEAAGPEEEATAIALLLRETLESPGKTAALVTPDAGLARRVVAKLARFGVAPQSSVGVPLADTPAGALLLDLCALAADSGDPLALAGLIAHPLAGPAAHSLPRAALRGPRAWADLPALLAHHPAAAPLQDALAPLLALSDAAEVALDALAAALAQAAEAACAPASPWVGPDGARAAEVLAGLMAQGAALGPVRRTAAPRLLVRLAAGVEVPPEPGGDPAIAILGPLEARLQQRDLMILADLNEGVWPAAPPDDMFLSRGMRADLGLPAPEVRIGLAAHDFAQLAGAPEVVLTRARRREGAPTVASRWVWRLLTLCRGALGAGALLPAPGRDAAAWAHGLDAPRGFQPFSPPAPRPPPLARPQRLSVTEVETLIRDPYAIYAKRVLRLAALDPVGAEPGGPERGSALHEALAQADGLDADALLAGWLAALAAHGFSPARCAAEAARLRPSAAAVTQWLAAQAQAGVQGFTEIDGALTLPDVGVRLTARADRLDLRPDGTVAVIDYKSGAAPSHKQVNIGLCPQLTLEAAMVAAGGFGDLPAAEPAELLYWKLGGRQPSLEAVKLDRPAPEAAAAALAELTGLLARYADPAQPYLCKPRPQFIKHEGDYDLLARRKEWAELEEGGEE